MKNKNIVGAYEGRKIDNERFLTALRTLCYIARFDEFNLKKRGGSIDNRPACCRMGAKNKIFRLILPPFSVL